MYIDASSVTRRPAAQQVGTALTLGWKPILGIVALTVAAFLIHGYHPYAEDAESYVPGIEKVLNPHLFPVNPEYFQMHAHLTVFPNLIALTVRDLHTSLPWALFLWQCASFFLLLLACWELMRRVFQTPVACWAGLGLVTALFTMPVAGTALYLMDPFLNPRNIIAFAEILAIVKVMERRYASAGLLLLFSGMVHPLMTAFSTSFCVLLAAIDRWPGKRLVTESVEESEAEQVAPAVILASPFNITGY